MDLCGEWEGDTFRQLQRPMGDETLLAKNPNQPTNEPKTQTIKKTKKPPKTEG